MFLSKQGPLGRSLRSSWRRITRTLGTRAGILAATLLIAATLASGWLAFDTFAQAPTKIRVGQTPVLISAPLFIAQEKGYFRDAGLDVEFVDIWQASEMLAGIASGDLQIGTGGVGAGLMNAINRGLDVRIVAPLHTERPPVTTPLVVSKALWDSGQVRSVADLRGRTVAINSKGSAVEYWLVAALATGGLTPNDVDVQVLSFPDAVTAMANGAIAGALIGEPVATRAEQGGIIVRLAEDFVDEFQVTAVYYTGNFVDRQRPAGEAFMRAFLRASRDLEGTGYRSPENLAILEKYTKVPAATIGASRLPYHDPEGRVRVQDFQQLHDFFMQQGTLTFSQPLDIGRLVDTSFADEARASAVVPPVRR